MRLSGRKGGVIERLSGFLARRKRHPTDDFSTTPPARKRTGPFEPHGSYGGIPYRVIDNGEVDALIFGTFVRFKTMEEFLAATRGDFRAS